MTSGCSTASQPPSIGSLRRAGRRIHAPAPGFPAPQTARLRLPTGVTSLRRRGSPCSGEGGNAESYAIHGTPAPVPVMARLPRLGRMQQPPARSTFISTTPSTSCRNAPSRERGTTSPFRPLCTHRTRLYTSGCTAACKHNIPKLYHFFALRSQLYRCTPVCMDV